MSTPFYDLASLVVVPSGYKSGKIYAQKPLTTDGQLTFTRASTATRVNASGLIETVSSGVPRLDYTNSSCPKILLEPQRSNIITQSQTFDNAAWSLSNGTITANTTVSPDGTQNADTYSETVGGNYIYQIATSSSGTFTVSIFVKKGSSTKIGIGLVAGGFTGGMSVQFNFDTQTFETPTNYGNFTSVSATSQSYGNGWYRLALTGTTATATTYYIVLGSLVGSAYAANVRLWGAQCEAGAYATSYIPTTSAAVTRVADEAYKTSITSLIGQTEGTIFIDFAGFNGSAHLITIGDGTAANYLMLYIDGSSIAWLSNGGLSGSAGTVTANSKAALAYKGNNSALYLNGVQILTNTSSTIPSLPNIYFNNNAVLSNINRLEVKQALVFKTRLTNAQLAELTTL